MNFEKMLKIRMVEGVRIEELPGGVLLDDAVPPEMPNSCRKSVDQNGYVGLEFNRANYKSIFIEDWATGAFNWPNCAGFKNNPVTHNMRFLKVERVCKYSLEKVFMKNPENPGRLQYSCAKLPNRCHTTRILCRFLENPILKTSGLIGSDWKMTTRNTTRKCSKTSVKKLTKYH